MYLPPGSSMKEPSYGVSVSDPVYVVDKLASKPAASLRQVQEQAAAQRKKQKQQPNGSTTTTGATTDKQPPAPKADTMGKQDDGSMYVYLPPGCSMKDPTYGVSVSDPVYVVDKPASPRKQAPPTGSSKDAGAGGKK